MTVDRTRAERLGDLLTAWVDRLPPRVRRFVPRELAGFAMLGGFTFAIDLAVLAMLRHWTHLPIAVAVAIAYIGAFTLNFMLNRTVNFRSHAPVGKQFLRYAVVMVGDFLITVVVTTALTMLGLDFRIARVLASVFVAVFTYTASRWWVFRDRPVPAPAVAVEDSDPDLDAVGGPVA
ncbi:GtrA family protein [Dactylosporangium sp. CA-139066]|uniref:GtrA family protein n=1 Tax=Dactylosporangium sp. CA-139066 TaxID=3239930 RepID=UPI003D8A38CF